VIWIVGDKGMLGTELSRLLDRQGLPFVGSDRNVDILDPGAIAEFARTQDVDAIVNCAAYTAVDKAEDEPELCRKLNGEGPANLAALAASRKAALIHISTDYVFAGDKNVPYVEEDPVNPQGVYGSTKATGEACVLALCPKAVILRTAWLYGEFGKNFVFTMLKLMESREEIGVVGDQYGTPTWARDLAGAIAAILRAEPRVSGIFHYTGDGATDWHEFACAIQEEALARGLLARPCTVKKLKTEEYPTKARRPAYSVLSKEKIARVLGLRIPHWKESLSAFFDSLDKAAGRQDV
jgi:dTDP-4-dehydrorhamnose reductase